MKLDFNLNLSQQQKLVMTQNMQLSINILQMSSLELNEFINKQIEENPILESEAREKNQLSDLEYKEIVKNNSYDNYSYYSGDSGESSISPLDFVAEKISLKSFLKEQLNCCKDIYDIRDIVEYMIESLDEKGYLEETLDKICIEFGIDEDKCNKALEFLQSLEPAGIGARSLNECLMIQLKRSGRLDTNLERIILNFLELVADNKFKAIAKALNISDLEAQNYGDLIKTLEPKPSRGFYTGDEVKFITPDAYIIKIDGQSLVVMNNEVTPQLTINNLYKDLVLNAQDKEAESYVKEKINSAMFLIKSINNRENTLKKILEAIVERQGEYIDKGIKYLKPMTLKDISEDINMHESTVSRAIREKYILTSYGTIKIKDLFTNKINSKTVDTEDVSTQSIKDAIKEIIDKEDKKKPYSDERICAELSEKNLNISRRTVAKYREEMGIKSSSKRKRI